MENLLLNQGLRRLVLSRFRSDRIKAAPQRFQRGTGPLRKAAPSRSGTRDPRLGGSQPDSQGGVLPRETVRPSLGACAALSPPSTCPHAFLTVVSRTTGCRQALHGQDEGGQGPGWLGGPGPPPSHAVPAGGTPQTQGAGVSHPEARPRGVMPARRCTHLLPHIPHAQAQAPCSLQRGWTI